MPISQIKRNRAAKLARIGRYPGSYADMLALVPADVASALSAWRLASLTDAMWRACQASKAIANAAAIAEGVVWDAQRKTLREIV